jgi:hypothetical protein
MANTKISGLTSATTPLAGTEVLPVVQSSTTTQVSVANLTAGRAISALSLTAPTVGAGSGSALSLQSNGVTNATLSSGGILGVGSTPSAWGSGYKEVEIGAGSTGGVSIGSSGSTGDVSQNAYNNGTNWIYKTSNYATLYRQQSGAHYFFNATSGTAGATISLTQAMTLFASGGLSLGNTTDPGATNLSVTGNLIQGTAAKGVNFTANTPAAGMTSQLLNWYEEGTWTPSFTAWSTAPTSIISATYTRIGRQVTLRFTAYQGNCAAQNIGGLPFTASGDSVAMMRDLSGGTKWSMGVTRNGTTTVISNLAVDFTGLYWAFCTTHFV